MPQWAVIGWPGQTGQTSFAALSQTVKTKSSLGESGFANSSQGLLRAPQAGIRADSSWRRASGLTVPLGWLPALNAVKFGLPLQFRMASAIIERAELPVQRKSTLKWLGITVSVLLLAAGWSAARIRVRRFRGANKGTHELAVDLGGDHGHVEAVGSKNVFRFFGAVNARRLDLDGLKSGVRQR